jgi:hypothetical protein
MDFDDGLRQRLAYGSFVSRSLRLLYVETPKALCTTMKWMLAIMEGARVPLVWKSGESQIELCIHYRDVHPLPALTSLSPAEQREVLESEAWRRFCIVRNPYARLVSAWANKICQREPNFVATGDVVMRHAGRKPAPDDAPTFDEFTAWLIDANDPSTCDAHWRTQTALLRPDVLRYTDVLRFETIVTDLGAFFRAGETTSRFDAPALLSSLRFNESIALDLRGIYDARIAARVEAFYHADFDTFGYDRDSWRTAGRTPEPEALAQSALRAVRARNRLIGGLGRLAATVNDLNKRLAEAQAEAVAANRRLDDERRKSSLLEEELRRLRSGPAGAP